MFVKEVTQKRKDGTSVVYLHLVDSVWDPEKKSPRHQVIKSLGRKDQIDSDAIGRLINSLRRYLEPEKAAGPVFEEVLSSKQFGLPYLLGQLWRQLGIDKFFHGKLRDRNIDAPIERCLFAMTAQRACDPGSKLACEQWAGSAAHIPGLPSVQVQQLYRAMDFLVEHGPELENDIYLQVSELLDLDLSVVFYDTTALYFQIEEEDEAGLRKRGHCKPGNGGHLPQVSVGLAVNRKGIPIRHWVWPGNTADVATVQQVVEDLKGLRPRRFLFAGDRGMISDANIDYLESRGLKYILGVEMRKDGRAEDLLSVRGSYREIDEDVSFKQKLVEEGDREVRYLLCLNKKSAARDQAKRQEMAEKLRQELQRPRAPEEGSAWSAQMLGHSLWRRWLKKDARGRLQLDEAALAAEARYDGKYLLVSNDLETDGGKLVEGFRELCRIERSVETMNGALDARPVYHRTEQRIRAHIQLCVLAYTLLRTAELRAGTTWHQISNILSPLPAVHVRFCDGTAVQRGQLTAEMRAICQKMEIPAPPRVLELS